MLNSNVNCEALLRQVYETGFAVDDILLYLDTHPADKDALDYYCYAVNLNKQAVKNYEAQCGPLMVNAAQPENCWSWVDNPWPWEGVCG